METWALTQAAPVTYTPDTNYNGQDSFTYTITDSSGEPRLGYGVCDRQAGQWPASCPGRQHIHRRGHCGNHSCARQWFWPRRRQHQRHLYHHPSHGSVSINAGTTITYTPDTNYNGTDTLHLHITDSTGATATVRWPWLSVPVPDPPVAQDDNTSTGPRTLRYTHSCAHDNDPWPRRRQRLSVNL